jgi:hypothetical protein
MDSSLDKELQVKNIDNDNDNDIDIESFNLNNQINFNDLKFLIYTSSKTSSISLLLTLYKKYFTKQFHFLEGFQNTVFNIPVKTSTTPQEFLNYIKEYNKINDKKLKIITIIRDPYERLASSFFDFYHINEINNKNIDLMHTTIMKYTNEYLYSMFKFMLENKSLPYYSTIESIYELSSILDTYIIKELNKICINDKHTYYYYENELIELYVLDFKQIIGENKLDYINKILKVNVEEYIPYNLSSERIYYKKYNKFKNKIQNDNEIKKLINNYYKPEDINFFNSFYF